MAGQMTMPVPGAALYAATASPADAVRGETDEQRRRRLQAMQNAKQLPGGSLAIGSGYGSAFDANF